MRVSYDEKMDVLYVTLRNKTIARTVEVGPALLDLDSAGDVVAFELLGASGIIDRVAELVKQPNLEAALADRLGTYIAQAQEGLAHERATSA